MRARLKKNCSNSHIPNRVDVILSAQQYYGDTMKLIIRNLSRTTTEVTLREMFEAHGAVQSCTVVMDKKSGLSKGFGFIVMPKAAAAKAAMKTLNATEIDGSKVRIKKCEMKSDIATKVDTKD